MNRARYAIAAVIVVAVVAGMTACGGGARQRAVVHVGSSTITAAAYDERIERVTPGHVPLEPPRFKRCIAYFQPQSSESIAGAAAEECRQLYESLHQRVLGSLIAEQWLIGEARERGLSLPDAGSASTLRKAEATLRDAARRGEPAITHAAIAAYYEQNLSQYGRPERRYLDIVERIPTRAAAQAALNLVTRRGDMHRVALHEFFSEEYLPRVVPWKRAILKAIFTARPHTLVGPLPLNGKWCFFEVTRVIARDVTPLAQVQGSIEKALAAEREKRRLAPFIAAWRKKWTARTHCSPGYVVQKCSEYGGPREEEPSSSFS